MTYRDKMIKNITLKLSKLKSEYDDLQGLLLILEGKTVDDNVIPTEEKTEVEDNVIPTKEVYVCLYKDSTETFNDTMVLHINRNKDIVEQVRDLKKNGFNIIVRDDSRSPEDYEILSKFANYLKLPLEK